MKCPRAGQFCGLAARGLTVRYKEWVITGTPTDERKVKLILRTSLDARAGRLERLTTGSVPQIWGEHKQDVTSHVR
ncbi:MAG TPA: hypothetical protein VGE97_08925 [Nitrososphaera sp.]